MVLACMETSELNERLGYLIDGERFVCLIHAGKEANMFEYAIEYGRAKKKKSERTEIIKHDKVRTHSCYLLMYA